MKIQLQKWLVAALLLIMSLGMVIQPANAYYYHHHYYGYDYRPTYFQMHPYQKYGLIGAGSGAVLGGLLSHGDVGGGAARGAVVGGGAGLGYEYLRRHTGF